MDFIMKLHILSKYTPISVFKIIEIPASNPYLNIEYKKVSFVHYGDKNCATK